MSRPSAEADLLSELTELVGDDLAASEEIFRRELDCGERAVESIVEHAALLQGKRLRPSLVLVSALASGGIEEGHRVLAAVVEMIHVATLVHDDVLDEADTRRHVATVHSRWDTKTSILFGDYLFTHAFHLASSLQSTEACRLIGRATNRVCEGELIQIAERGNLNLAESRYIEIVEAKTAELVSVSCRLGSGHGRDDPRLADALADYGRRLGIAFQIADDLLDLTGDESRVGKTLGSDLATGKLTLPLVHLLHSGSKAEVDEVRRLLTEPDEQTGERLLPLLVASGSLDYARDRAEQYATEACERLEILPDSPARRCLEGVTAFAVHRSC
ncbi:polyprenyl synthetase family protein [Stratiformator vulcanicus]|uniref:Octaprenyl-diphosphate synthase n=1 Tax=Stratiformator vulcanicus TaxID=2527980 RepID=A0A517R6X5_9PLAN|nr:polyprenyl synthetase family protein [Stratiformator vulcanicus]QDT39602.1 Octaprenyl-diphosphate synthase [Stratiformator vulcanicus]